MLSADRRRRVAWGANAPSLSTVIAAAAMMNGAAHRRLNSQIAFPVSGFPKLKTQACQAPGKKNQTFGAVVSFRT